MRLKEIYGSGNKTDKLPAGKKAPIISYEVFPLKNDTDGAKVEKLVEELDKLKKYNPALVSVTYGAGGSNQNQSLDIISRIKDELKLNPMPHFTCVSTCRENIKEYMETVEKLGICNILALRGDIPEGGYCTDFRHASELVEYIKSDHNLSVAVAGYPEGHNEAESLEKDIEWLHYKVDKGADVVYTQLFFDNTKFFGFIELCANQGIKAPVVPGILPVTSYNQLSKMASLCKVTIPSLFLEKLEAHKDDADYTRKLGIEFAVSQCSQLVKEGVPGLHFYTLNKSAAVSEILENIL